MSDVKQVIVIRKDLKMRRGKEIAQAAHASMKWLVDRLEYKGRVLGAHEYYPPHFTDEEQGWLAGSFTKVCLQVNSEEELVQVLADAFRAGLNVRLIVDNGTTEFSGVPTKTCLAIGPHTSEKIDPITSHLKLY
jgi:PTH2 family peptidyl-tRNA hydrolase